MSEKAASFKNEPIAGRDIYVDLDSLFDTRLAILDKIDTRYATLVYEAGYCNRTEDAFPRLSKEAFKKLFDDRDNDVLSRALLTNVIGMVKDHIKENVLHLHNTPGGREINVYVNVWPYEFDKEGVEMILKPIYDLEQNRVNVHALNVDPKELPASWFGQKFAFIVMYDYMRWLNNILDDPKTLQHKMPKTTLIAPKLFLNETYSEKEYQEHIDAGNFDPFREVELICSQFIGLEYYETPLFSALLPPDFIQKRKEELGLNDV